jgi:hypothetical protein
MACILVCISFGCDVVLCRDATIFFAKMALDPADVAGATIDSLSYAEIDTLRDWVRTLSLLFSAAAHVALACLAPPRAQRP